MKDAIQIKHVLLGGLPIIDSITKTLDIQQLLAQYVPDDSREKIPTSKVLGVMLCNVVMERFPLYKVSEWAHDRVPVAISRFLNDDRCGRALDRLFKSDRASLLTAIVLQAIQAYELDTSRVHNDSTTIKLFGEYAGSYFGAATPKRGHSKDHRPDLKQLLFNLNVLGDEAVPLYFKVLDGNITDDRTHLKNWMALRGLLGKTDFIYVADCKLCVKESMEFIDAESGKFVTVLPQTRNEDKKFKDWIQDNSPSWIQVKELPGKRSTDPVSTWWTFECPYPSKEGFRIIWVKSSDKQKNDEQKRATAIEKTVGELEALQNKDHRSNKKLTSLVQDVFGRNKTECYFHWKIVAENEEIFKQSHMGRPTSKTTYKKIVKKKYVLNFTHNQEYIRYQSKCDGIFPLITNLKVPSLEVLEIYKFQPRLEKRHEQLKSVYHVAPIFLKNLKRIEALLFLYFLGLLVTALIERSVRLAMKKKGLASIPIYPEQRDCRRPTADKILDLFRDVRFQSVMQQRKQLAQVPDKLNTTQKLVLNLLGIDEIKYFTATIF
jgi:transposase